MKASSNLLILGAGASMDYGFPSGTDLKIRAISLLENDKTEAYNLLIEAGEKLGFDNADLLLFNNALKRATLDYSIDAFIEANHDNKEIDKLTNIAKCIIASLIVECENSQKLSQAKQDWYFELFKKMYTGNNSFGRFFDNKVNFVTFNYDRSLEQYLLSAVAEQFNKPKIDCADQLNRNFQVIHVHGSLGDIWNEGTTTSYRDYAPKIDNANALISAAAKIKLITDDINPLLDAEFNKANDLICSSDTVHFIGFGYDDNNMIRLGFGNKNPDFLGHDIHGGSARDDKFFGTVKGVSEQRVRECVRKYHLNTVSYVPSAGSERYGLSESVDGSTTAFNYINIAPLD